MVNKKQLLSTFLIAVGAALLISALVLFLRNSEENKDAREAAAERLEIVKTAISQRVEEEKNSPTEPTDEMIAAELMGTVSEMTVVNLGGVGYIGYLSAPTINLEMPVMAEWSEYNLKLALCRHYGSAEEGNLVIAGHNYNSGFGKLRDLKNGDELYYTDMNGRARKYVVEEIEILNADDIEKMINSSWNLSLYTCTYNGKQRVTVRCREVE